MNVIFNELSLNIPTETRERERVLKVLIDTCKYIMQVNDAIGENALKLRVNEDFWNIGFWNDDEKFSDTNYNFLMSVTESPYLGDEYEVDETIFIDNTLSLGGKTLSPDAGLRVASAWQNGVLVLSLDIGVWSNQKKINITRDDGSDINLYNATNQQDILEYLELFPKWENYNFDVWRKEAFNKANRKGDKTEIIHNVKVLPIPKLSDLVWLAFIEEYELWERNSKERNRDKLWGVFVARLRALPNGGEKEKDVLNIYSRIVRINQFEISQVCSKPKRPIYTWKGEYYLLPDKQHGAFEVYDKKRKHQGEWHFYGDENIDKKVDKDRDICN